MKAAAVACWVLAWMCAGSVPAAFFAARDGKTRTARIELAGGLFAAGCFAAAGVVLW